MPVTASSGAGYYKNATSLIMKKMIFTVLLTFSMAYAFCQEIPEGFPKQAYKFSQQINRELTQEELRSARASWHYSYIGKYQEAMDTYPDVDTRHGFDQLSKEDSLHFLTFEAADAFEYILERAKKEQIIIINEAHHKPQHRVFTRRLLAGLYNEGFRYFGLECLTPNAMDTTAKELILDTVLQERGYPLHSYFTGTYTTEPQMANLVRDGIKTGFTIFAYERFRKGDREQKQAENINRILEQDSTAKILIHCGWDHLLEDTISTSGKQHWMAWHLKQMTGIAPFTINQDFLTEGKKGAEAKLFTIINETRTSVFVNKKGETYNGPKGWNKFDVLVYHPRSKYQKNRPDWLTTLEGHKLYELDKSRIEIDYPVLVKVYHPDERPDATPWDIIELASEEDQTALVLPGGNFVLKLNNPVGEEQEISILVK